MGPLADLGIYMLHTLTELLGPVHRVAALTGISVPERTVLYGPATGKQITVTEDDNTQLLLDFGDATFAHLDSTFCAWSTPGPTLEIYGSEGVLALDSIYDPQGMAATFEDVDIPLRVRCHGAGVDQRGGAGVGARHRTGCATSL